jgi:hypothetical protein
MTEYDSHPDDCNHSNVTIVNIRPDRFGKTMYDDSDEDGGFDIHRMHAYDARCEDCGYRGTVVYRFERLEDFR